MKNTTLKIFALAFCGLITSNVISQTNPTPFNMETSGTYSLTSWAATSPAGTYPNNMVFHTMANTNPTLSSVASGNVTGVYNDASTVTRMNGLGTGGFSFRNSSTTPDLTGYIANRLGEAVLAVNTTNRTNVNVSFKAGEIGTKTPIWAITCEYRIGTSGAYNSLPGASTLWQYRSDNPSSSVTFAPITLPTSCDNQPVVQIRWAYSYISGPLTSVKPQLFVDEISVTSKPIVNISALPGVCSTAPSFLLSDGTPATSGLGTGVYSGTGVVGGNFDPSVSGVGVFTITYTYTDINGFSNFATTTQTVDPSFCVAASGLAPVSCGATNVSVSGYVNCVGISGATNYEYTFTAPGYSASKVVAAPYLSLHLTTLSPGLINGTTYNVTVKAQVGGIWGAAGPTCTITTSSLVPPSLTPASCGATGLSTASYISCNATPGATDYEWTFTNGSGFLYVKSVVGPYRNLQLNKVPGLAVGTYDVSMKAKVGGVWTAAGPTCPISISTVLLIQDATDARQMEFSDSDLSDSQIKMYPNPLSKNSVLNVELAQNETITVIISDIMGRRAFEKSYIDVNAFEISLSDLKLEEGLYNLSVINGTCLQNQKLVITR